MLKRFKENGWAGFKLDVFNYLLFDLLQRSVAWCEKNSGHQLDSVKSVN